MNDHVPAITVLMPAYNTEAYIAEAIESILNQGFTDFEFLIINDGSTDGTLQIIESYTDPRIKYYTIENRGVTGALNFGLSLSRGTYIARFDADDVCYPQRLQVQFEFLEQNPGYVLVGSEADYIDQNGKYLFTYRFSDYENDEIRTAAFKECPFIHASVMYRKQAVIAAGSYDKDAITFEDHLLWRNLASYGKMKNLHEPLIKVRFNAASVTIDEKWRGPEFRKIKQDAVKRGSVTADEAKALQAIVKKQDFKKYKEAAYYSMIAKKLLWNQYDPAKARTHLRTAIRIMPLRREPYVLFLLSFLPEKMIKSIYHNVKKRS